MGRRMACNETEGSSEVQTEVHQEDARDRNMVEVRQG